ncbi:YtjB family periplasmic protein, partial [Enterobacter asburiae]
EKGNLIARAGQHLHLRHTHPMDAKKPRAYIKPHNVETIKPNNAPQGYIRQNLYNHTHPTEPKPFN